MVNRKYAELAEIMEDIEEETIKRMVDSAGDFKELVKDYNEDRYEEYIALKKEYDELLQGDTT